MAEPSTRDFGQFVREVEAQCGSPAGILGRFAAGPDELERALKGLSEADLDLARAPGKWTIRQIVHHVVVGDDMVILRAKAALGSSGAVFHGDWYDHEAWVDTLDFAGRDIGFGLALLRANRRYIADLVERLPNAWERYVAVVRPGAPAGHKMTVGTVILILAAHIPWHVEQIGATRAVHGVWTQ
jgi:hypothetical protein